jgi:D-amino-acid dehydrogenase
MAGADAIVIGGGVVGSAVAYHLARDGHDTLLLDRRDEGRATDAGAGILSPPTSSRTASDAWFDLAVPAVEHYPDLVDRLREAGVGETGYAQCGLLNVAMDGADTAAMAANERRIRKRQAALGYPPEGTIQELDPCEAVERFPPLAEPERALYYEGAAKVDGKRLERALREAGTRHGLAIEETGADRLRVEDGTVTGVVTAEGTLPTGTAVIAGGAWSSAFAGQLGVRIPVSPQRGQIVHVQSGAEGSAGWPVVTGFDHRYMVPWAGGRVAVGATDEAGVGYEPHATVAGVHELLTTARNLAPGLDDARICETRTGLRPVTPDGLPVLGPVPGVDGVLLATGHGATGLQLGPYTGRVIAALAARRAPPVDLSPFRVTRFDDAPAGGGSV